MGRLRVLVFIAMTACGRLGFEDTSVPADAFVASNLAPQTCQSATWDNIALTNPDVDLSVVQTPTGVTAVWVARAGSPLYGINIGSDWGVSGNPAGTLINPGTWRLASVTFVDGALIAGVAALDRSDVKIDLVQPSLSSYTENACPLGAVISAPPLLHAGPDLVAPVTSDIGMTVIPFNATFVVAASQLSVASSMGPTTMTATRFGNTAVVAWSTITECFVEQLMDMATGFGSQYGMPCASPKLTADSSEVVLVFERAGGIYLSRGAPLLVSANTATMLASGTSPRIAFDGNQFWISYRDDTGHLVAGYFGFDGMLRVTSLASAPMHDAYDLTIVNGQPWIFTITAGSMSAVRLCIPPA
jgi:hypothetical protein